jgi:hypothetical protein
MRSFLLGIGVLAFLVGVAIIADARNAFQESEGVLAILTAVVALSAAAIIAAVDRLRDATVKIYDLERLERAQHALEGSAPSSKPAVG